LFQGGGVNFNSAIVVGSSGFIGTHLRYALAEKGINEIHKIDIRLLLIGLRIAVGGG
jgi:nucleoside-diphosphate-sugar epimerase